MELRAFIFTTSGGGNDAVPASLLAQNATYTTSGANGTKLNTTFYVNLQNPVTAQDVSNHLHIITGNQVLVNAGVSVENWITDSVDSTLRIASSGAATGLGGGNGLAAGSW